MKLLLLTLLVLTSLTQIGITQADYIVELQVFGNPLYTFNVTVDSIEELFKSEVLRDIGDLIQVRRVIRRSSIDLGKLIKKTFKSHIRLG